MSNYLIGTVDFLDSGEKIVKANGMFYKLSSNFEESNISQGSKVKFVLEKKIFSDKIEIFAKIVNSTTQSWDEVYKSFLKVSNNMTLSEYQSFLSSNYESPKKIWN